MLSVSRVRTLGSHRKSNRPRAAFQLRPPAIAAAAPRPAEIADPPGIRAAHLDVGHLGGPSRATLTSGQLVTVPAGRKHAFTNTGPTTLRIQSTLAAPVFEAAYDDARETPRRWLPG